MTVEHDCTQRVTLNTICIKLENIELCITEIKEFQNKFTERLDLQKAEMEAIRLNSARYPTPEEVGRSMDKIKLHDTYFAIGGIVLVAVWGLLLWIGDKLWKVIA